MQKGVGYFFKSFRRKVLSEGECRVSKKNSARELKNIVGILGGKYSSYFQSRSQNLSHYYHFLFNIFKFIDEADIDDVSKKKYANILRAQISNYELIMLFYNSLTIEGEKFKFYFVKYEVLDNLPVIKLIYQNHVLLVDKACRGITI